MTPIVLRCTCGKVDGSLDEWARVGCCPECGSNVRQEVNCYAQVKPWAGGKGAVVAFVPMAGEIVGLDLMKRVFQEQGNYARFFEESRRIQGTYYFYTLFDRAYFVKRLRKLLDEAGYQRIPAHVRGVYAWVEEQEMKDRVGEDLTSELLGSTSVEESFLGKPSPECGAQLVFGEGTTRNVSGPCTLQKGHEGEHACEGVRWEI